MCDLEPNSAGQEFQVFGHAVTCYSPGLVKLSLHRSNHPEEWIGAQAQRLVAYLVQEKFLDTDTINVIVETR
jgi:hypothetical protein